jgi:hypothetical protein
MCGEPHTIYLLRCARREIYAVLEIWLAKRAVQIPRFEKGNVMKNITVTLIFSILLVSTFANAKLVPNSGASGDKRRVLTAGLRIMGGVAISNSGHGGSYGGLYNVQCTIAEGYPMLCQASTTENGPLSIWNSTEGAVLVGSVLRMNIDGALNASVIKAKLVECNSVGDECYIEGIDIQ